MKTCGKYYCLCVHKNIPIKIASDIKENFVLFALITKINTLITRNFQTQQNKK